jgi:hypothetical protein
MTCVPPDYGIFSLHSVAKKGSKSLLGIAPNRILFFRIINLSGAIINNLFERRQSPSEGLRNDVWHKSFKPLDR